jgi:hypothetical protein
VVDAAVAGFETAGTVANERPREPVGNLTVDGRLVVVDFLPE